MSVESEIAERSQGQCELCGAKENLKVYEVPPTRSGAVQDHVHVCQKCFEQLDDAQKVDTNHWRCLNDSMWSQVPGVQVVAWRMLNQMKSEGWPLDLLEMLYLDEETMVWAQAGIDSADREDIIKHIDSNGTILEAGDTVILIKDLNVKGANFTAKRGTAVRRISLDPNNAEYIEGKVDGQHIVIVTKFVKKSK